MLSYQDKQEYQAAIKSLIKAKADPSCGVLSAAGEGCNEVLKILANAKANMNMSIRVTFLHRL